MAVPVWLLDIDGVLNAVGGRNVFRNKWPESLWLESEYTVHGSGPYRVVVAQPVVDFINLVHGQGLVEVRWHTTWQHDALRLGEWLKLPSFPVHPAPEYLATFKRGWWKLPGAYRVTKENRSLIWTDDDIRYEIRPNNQLYQPSNLIISPDDRYGLSPDDLDKIKTFLEKETGDA